MRRLAEPLRAFETGALGARYFETHGRFGQSSEARARQARADALIARAMAR